MVLGVGKSFQGKVANAYSKSRQMTPWALLHTSLNHFHIKKKE